MHRYTNAALPYWDAAITVISLVAQWLMAKKILECWLLWITVDVLAIGVYAVKKLYPTTGLYAVFLVLAVLGYLTWKKALKKRLLV
jgi:nicotinamide mononucleotide transporter